MAGEGRPTDDRARQAPGAGGDQDAGAGAREAAAADGHKPLVVAAIPCFNEERYIGSVVLAVRKYADRVLVVDDGSADASAEIAAAAGAAVVGHGGNRGYGAAVRTALARGRELGADVLVVIDGDGQHDAREIPRLVQPVLAGEADVVIGSRFLGKPHAAPLYRRFGQRVLTAATNVGSGRKLSDSQSGFRAYSARAMSLLDLTEDGMSVSSEMQFAIASKGLRVTEVPIQVSYADKAKRNPVGHGINVLGRVLVLLSLRQPFVLFGIPGVVLLAGGLVLGVRVLDIYSNTQALALGTLLGAILLCLTGMLGLFAALVLQAMKELLRGQWERFEETRTGG